MNFSSFVDILVGLLRLRKCSPETFRPELKNRCSIVRELHVYPLQTFNLELSVFCLMNDTVNLF